MNVGGVNEGACPNMDAEDTGGKVNVGGVNAGTCPNMDIEDTSGEVNAGGVNVGTCPCPVTDLKPQDPEGAVVVGGVSVVGSGW